MADAADSKSVARKGVWVQVPPPALRISRERTRFGIGQPHVLKPQEWQLFGSLLGKSPKNAWIVAEIKSCCMLASLLDVQLIRAAQNVVPVAVTAGDKIECLRQAASGRCLSADRAGVYARSESVRGGRQRRVVRERGCIEHLTETREDLPDQPPAWTQRDETDVNATPRHSS
ncbi:MAG: ATP-dependent zinc metalloprotease FtsH [Planctomycetota bacterium]